MNLNSLFRGMTIFFIMFTSTANMSEIEHKEITMMEEKKAEIENESLDSLQEVVTLAKPEKNSEVAKTSIAPKKKIKKKKEEPTEQTVVKPKPVAPTQGYPKITIKTKENPPKGQKSNDNNKNNNDNKNKSDNNKNDHSGYKPVKEKPKWKTFTLTFYTSLPSENGGWSLTASGKKISNIPKPMIANNYYPLGSKIYLEGYGLLKVEDRGGKDFNSSTGLDIYIPRHKGESASSYYRRVNNMGRKKVRGYLKN